MPYPQLTEYLNSIRSSEDYFDELASLRPVLDNQGDPLRSVGGFAVVFKMQDVDTGLFYAIKCFHEDQEGRKESYEKISRFLSRIKSPYLLDVRYYPKELYVDTSVSDDKEFPVLLMDWIEGDTMESYISSHYRDTDAIFSLYKRFCDMAVWLRSQPFAHGDIKPDNIMIRPDGSLVLVDYDGMYVPSFAGQKSPTIGTRAFSHPLRTPDDFDEHIDDFALASISISLLAMSKDNSLLTDLGARDRLLFTDTDYLDFHNSTAYKRLMQMGGLFPKLLDLFSKCMKSNGKENNAHYDKLFDIQTSAPKIHSFVSSSGLIVYSGDSTSLKWETENATLIHINGKDVTNDNEYRIKLRDTRSFELVASNGLKESTAKITVEVLQEPSISFHSDRNKLHKDKDESVQLSWKIKQAVSATLKHDGESQAVALIDKALIPINKSTNFILEVLGLDGKRLFTKALFIGVFTDSNVSFVSDKTYSLPEVPIQLSWHVMNAKSVRLDGFGEVTHTGTKTVFPKKDTVYSLFVSDAFGEKRHDIEVKMLPLPTISSVFAPTPKIESTMNVSISSTSISIEPHIPSLQIATINLKVPEVPSLVDLGLMVHIDEPKVQKESFMDRFSSLFNFVKHKKLI